MYCLGVMVMMEWSGDGIITMDDASKNIGEEERQTDKKKREISSEQAIKACPKK